MNEKLRDFILKYDLYGCIQCGRCTGGCPVTVRTNLNVRRFVYDALDQGMLHDLAKLPEIWDCTACNTCAVRCPKGLKPLEVLMGLRSIMVIEHGNAQSTVRDALESVFLQGNPWNKPKATRSDWMEGLAVKIAEPGKKVENLIFVCCTIAYNPQIQVLAKNLLKLLIMAGVDYGFIGEKESCCSCEVHYLGEDDLLAEMVQSNTELLNAYDAARIVTISPHCLNAFKTHYPDLKAEVIHYTQLVVELLEDRRLCLTKEFPEKIVYHDPCFLGKHNNVYNEPRAILGKIPGAEVLEFERRRERSLCCEGGGGRMWVESKSAKERLAKTRVKAAWELGAGILAVACPFCILTLDDAVKAEGLELQMRVAEILEIIGELV